MVLRSQCIWLMRFATNSNQKYDLFFHVCDAFIFFSNFLHFTALTFLCFFFIWSFPCMSRRVRVGSILSRQVFCLFYDDIRSCDFVHETFLSEFLFVATSSILSSCQTLSRVVLDASQVVSFS